MVPDRSALFPSGGHDARAFGWCGRRARGKLFACFLFVVCVPAGGGRGGSLISFHVFWSTITKYEGTKSSLKVGPSSPFLVFSIVACVLCFVYFSLWPGAPSVVNGKMLRPARGKKNAAAHSAGDCRQGLDELSC